MKAAAPKSEPVAERRLVSILFADLVGFTPFAEQRDSEEVRETLVRYFDMASQVIGRYGGTVEKFIGDAVMAVWGAPSSHEDDAERAVRAALELVAAVPALGAGIQARAGVLTGEAAVTLGATNQGMVAGDIVNTASRLQSVAPAGAVLVGETTHRAASAAIAYEKVEDQTLKGKQSPVSAWRALRVVAEVGGRNRADTLEAPFVGRAEELRLLKDLFHATGRDRRLYVVSISGPAGTGKSRLAREFANYIDGLVEEVWWHGGRSPAYGEGITFWALGEMVRERAGLHEQDDEPTTRDKVSHAVSKWIDDADERSWIERGLLALLGLEADIPPDQLFGAWRTFFERIADKGSVVLVFEDMHFADQGLLDFVDHMLDFSRDRPIYIVSLARPDLFERRPQWSGSKRNFLSLYLGALPDEDMRDLLAGLAPGLPGEAVSTIVARADGVPLYAAETVRALIADGRLAVENGLYAPVGDLRDLSVPETLTALIASRLDLLEDGARRALHAGAVLGQSFTIRALAFVTGEAEHALEEQLSSLVRLEVLRREMDVRSPERGQYAFVQAIVREVAYNTLSKRDRRSLHLAAAHYFERLDNEEIAGAVASHYLAAHAAAPAGPEQDAIVEQARSALTSAATRAAGLGSFDQAVSLLEQALAITPDIAERARLLEQAATHAISAARWEKAEAMLRQALEHSRQAGDLSASISATAKLGLVLARVYRLEEAIRILTAGAELTSDLPPEPAVTELQTNLAVAHLLSGQAQRSLDVLEPIMGAVETHASPETVAVALMTKGNALASVGRLLEGAALLRAAIEFAADHGLTETRLRAMSNLSGHLGEFDVGAALAALREALALARRTGHRGQVLHLIVNLGYMGHVGGAWDEALAEIETVMGDDLEARDRLEILENATVIRAARGESVSAALAQMKMLKAEIDESLDGAFADPVANAALAAGDLDRARDAFAGLARSSPWQAAEFYYRAARPAMWARDLDKARDFLDLFDSVAGSSPVIKARRLTMSASIAALEGRSADALDGYRDALGAWRATASVWDEGLTGVDMAELLDPTEPEVMDVIASTRAILERLRARPYIERLDAAVARGAQGGTRNPVRIAAAKATAAIGPG